MKDPFANFTKVVLQNGLTLYVNHDPDLPFVRMHFSIFAGGKHDKRGLEGTAHFMEHLVCQNGGSTLQDLLDFFESTSGRPPLLGRTSFHSTEYGFVSPLDTAALDQGLAYFGNMLLHGQLTEHVERERGVIKGEFQQRFKAPYEYDLAMRERRSVFPNSFFSRCATPLGSLESIERITQRDLQDFYDRHYVPANMHVAIMGGLSVRDVTRSFERSPFAAQKDGRRTLPNMVVAHPPLPSDTLEVFHLAEHRKGTTAGEFTTIAQLPGNTDPWLITILKRMLFKKLFSELREKRAWTYSAGADSHRFPEFTLFEIGSRGVRLDALDEIDNVVTTCLESLAMDQDLFDSSKQFCLKQVWFRELATDDITSDALEDLLHEGRIVPRGEELKSIEEITLDHVAYVIKHLARDRRRTLIKRP